MITIAIQAGMVVDLNISSLLNLALVIGIAIIPFLIIRGVCISVLKNFFRKPGNPIELECANLPESFFCQYAYDNSYMELYNIDSYLDKICNSLGLDTANFKVDLGKQSGGYTDFYHVGTGGVRISGTDAVFGVLSRIMAGSRNSAVNSRIKSLETLLYYNKLVVHFYEKIFSKCNISILYGFIPREDNASQTEATAQPVSAVESDENSYEQPVSPQPYNELSYYEQPIVSNSKKNTTALVGFILSLIGAVGFMFFGVPAVPGLICSIIGVAQNKKHQGSPRKGLAIAGIILGIIAVVFYGTIIAVRMFG